MLDLEEWPFLTHMQPQYRRPASVPRRRHPLGPKSPYRGQDFRAVHTPDYPIQQTRGQLKRHRDQDDIEGDETPNLKRKKRKLRQSLTTSRLSEPYAAPSTYIPSRKALREGIWARQRVAGRNLLRKAAAINSFIKKRAASRAASGNSHTSSAAVGSLPKAAQSRWSPERESPPPSPASSTFSDFHIFDFEDDSIPDDESDWEGLDAINSDFNKFQEADWNVRTHVEEYGFDSSSSLETEDIYSFDPGGKAIGMIMENERQNEVSWAPGVLS